MFLERCHWCQAGNDAKRILTLLRLDNTKQLYNTMIPSIIFLLTLLLLTSSASCHSFRRRIQGGEPLLPEGIWTFRGYGYTISVQNGMAMAFEETDISCIENSLLLDELTGAQVSGDVANVTAFPFVPYFVLDRTDSFQAACADGITPFVGTENYTRDALVGFDIFNQTFVEHFAHLDSRLEGGTSEWILNTMEIRANLTSDSTDQELVNAFEQLLVPLDDYHTWVTDRSTFFVSAHPFLWEFEEEFQQQNVIADWETYQQEKIIVPWRENAASYLQELNVESTGLAWGRTNSRNSNIGYLWLTTIPNDMATFAPEFEAALTALNDTDALIFDIRVNSGGSDETAVLIASYFSTEPFLAFRKQAKAGGDLMDVRAEPSNLVYQKPVVMIISGSSYSAAETLPLTMMQLPQTTLLGRNSGGSYSELPKTLPNGWAFSLFAEVYLSPDGIDYDDVGIPPDVLPDTELLPLSEREGGTDSWLELAIATANDAAASTTSEASKVRYWCGLWLMSLLIVNF